MAGPRFRSLAKISLFLPRQFALAGCIFALVPFYELAVLNDVFGNQGHSVLAVIVEGDLADNRINILDVAESSDDLFAVGSHSLDRVEDHVHRRIGEGAISFRRAIVFLSVVILDEEFTAWQLFGRRAFAEGERSFCEWAETLNIGIGDNA